MCIRDSSKCGVNLSFVYFVGVSMQQFAVLVSFPDVFHINLSSFFVGPLNASANWCVITCHRQSYGGAITKFILLLHKSLSKGSSADYSCPIPILQSTRNNFAGACRKFINQHYQFSGFKETRAFCCIFSSLNVCSFCI